MGFHDKRRHWYHLSSKLMRSGKFVLKPWGGDKAVNRDLASEPEGKRISVAPAVAQCLTALPQGRGPLHIYRTHYKVKTKKPTGVFDATVTKEGWLLRPTIFVYQGSIDFSAMEDELGDQFWPEDAACCDGPDSDDVLTSKEALQDWRKLMPSIDKYTKPVTFNDDETHN